MFLPPKYYGMYVGKCFVFIFRRPLRSTSIFLQIHIFWDVFRGRGGGHGTNDTTYDSNQIFYKKSINDHMNVNIKTKNTPYAGIFLR